MSSEQELVLYKKFYTAVYAIFERKNLLKRLEELNLEKDSLFIGIIFRSISKPNDDPDYMNWTNEEWVESMKYPEIYLLSFLFKKQLTIHKIYNMTSQTELKNNLLESYKCLVRTVKFLESLEKAKKLFIDTSVNLEKIKDKQLQIALNIKNYKDPKNLANIIDLLYHKQFRDNLFENVIKGINKIDISVLKNISDSYDSNVVELVEKYCTQTNIKKLFIFLMKIDVKGDVFVNDKIFNAVKNYINEVIKNSDQLQKLFNDIEKSVMDAETVYKNKINVIVLDNTKDIINECSMSTNKIKFSNDIFSSFDSFSNGEYIKFKSIDLIKRIRNTIFIGIQKVIEISALPKESKISVFNTFVKKYFMDELENDQDFIMLDKERLKNVIENDNSSTKPLKQKIKTLLTELFNSISEDDEMKDLVVLKNEFLEIIKYMIKMDFSKISKEEFNIFHNLALKLLKKPNQLRFLLIKVLNADIFKKFISQFEEDSSLKINPDVKKQIGEKSLKVIEEIVQVLIDTTITKDFEKYSMFVAKVLDYALYYAMKLKSLNLKPSIVKQKKVIG